MKILVLNFEYPPIGGGAAYATQELIRQYLEMGHKVSLVTMHFENLPHKETEGNLSVIRVKCRRSKAEISHPHELLSYIISARNFLNVYLKQEPHDICHCHFLLPTGLIALWAKRKFGLKYVITVHGSDVPGFNPDRFVFLHHFTRPIIRQIVKESAGIVSPSSYLGELLQTILKERSRSISVIPNGIDLDKFHPAAKAGYVLTSGRLLPRKGVRSLLLAVASQDIGYPVHICGDGPMRSELERIGMQSATQIIFHGWLSNQEEKYLKLLSDASVYVLLSTHENASISLLEAMASGCAIICMNSTGSKELVADSGILLDNLDPLAVHKAIKTLVNDPAMSAELGKRARERAENRYGWDKIGQTYSATLKRCLGG